MLVCRQIKTTFCVQIWIFQSNKNMKCVIFVCSNEKRDILFNLQVKKLKHLQNVTWLHVTNKNPSHWFVQQSRFDSSLLSYIRWWREQNHHSFTRMHLLSDLFFFCSTFMMGQLHLDRNLLLFFPTFNCSPVSCWDIF